MTDPLRMKELQFTLHKLKVFYYSRKRWPHRLKDVLITANVYSTTGNCTDSVLRKPLFHQSEAARYAYTELHSVQRKRKSA